MFRAPILVLTLLAACSGVSSDREAELAYLGLDPSIDRALALGLKGFSEADSANIATQTGDGDVTGVMTVDGKADQGASDNKGLRLDVALVDYQDVADVDQDGAGDLVIAYATADGAPARLELKLHGVPDGTFDGTFVGDFGMAGDLDGVIALDLALAGGLQADPSIPGGTKREVGTMTIVGTATNDAGGVFDVDVAR